MGARAIQGKPGSGKSCYAVHLITILLADWARYKQQHGREYPRKLYTNIPLDVEALNDYLSKEIDSKVDLSSQIEVLGDDFFCNEKGEYIEWWEKFPESAYIVIDEFQYLLSASSKRDKKGEDFTEKFMLYISKHRHRQHDIILMSQSIKNISVEARRQLEVIYSVLNVKNVTVGRWPYSIPMQDIDVVREAWGLPAQMAHIKRGVCEDEKIVYDKNYEVFLLRPSLFKLYKSVTMSSEVLDRPSLNLGKFGALLWLARRHAIRWVIATIMLVSIVSAFVSAVAKIPDSLVQGFASPAPQKQVKGSPASQKTGDNGNSETEKRPAALKPGDDEILGFFRGGVITPRGVLRIGDELVTGGEKETLKSVDVLRGVVKFKSGKEMKK